MSTPLMALMDQPGQIVAYKIVTKDQVGIYNAGLLYTIGESVEVLDACTDANRDYGPGVNVATADWCLKEWKPGYRIFRVTHTATDIAAIPIGSDGKYRVFRCTVLSEVDLLKDWGFDPSPRADAVEEGK
jgi:hypothetical protein